MRRYTLTGKESPRLALDTFEAAQPGKGMMSVDIKAASLNYRDLIVSRQFSAVVPLSDGAGVVAALGEGVEGFALGDRVVIGFMPGWVEGEFSPAKKATSLGGPGMDGVLTERLIVSATGVAHIPDSMTFEEAATLPCAGVTAWSALFERRPSCLGKQCCFSARVAFRSSLCSSRRWPARASS